MHLPSGLSSTSRENFCSVRNRATIYAMTTTWFEALSNGDAINAAAKKAGVDQATLNRQLAKGVLSPAMTVALARAYQVDVLDALVTQGLITDDDIAAHGIRVSLADASDAELARAISERLTGDRHPVFDVPVAPSRDVRVDRMAAKWEDMALAADDERREH